MENNSRLIHLKALLEDDPNDGFLLFAIAKEYEGMHDFDQALISYHLLLEKDPMYVGLYYHLGALYQEIDEMDKALDIYTQGIQIAISIKDLHALSELKSAKMNLEMEM